MLSLDTGDSNVYSVFRNSRYTANFVCVVSFYRVTVYLQDNSAPLFLEALEYAVRVYKNVTGNDVREIVSGMFSTYMDTRLIANFRDSLLCTVATWVRFSRPITHRPLEKTST
jgi:hypothetical protein